MTMSEDHAQELKAKDARIAKMEADDLFFKEFHHKTLEDTLGHVWLYRLLDPYACVSRHTVERRNRLFVVNW